MINAVAVLTCAQEREAVLAKECRQHLKSNPNHEGQPEAGCSACDGLFGQRWLLRELMACLTELLTQNAKLLAEAIHRVPPDGDSAAVLTCAQKMINGELVRCPAGEFIEWLEAISGVRSDSNAAAISLAAAFIRDLVACLTHLQEQRDALKAKVELVCLCNIYAYDCDCPIHKSLYYGTK